MVEAPVVTEAQGGVLWISLNRVDRLNAVSEELYEELIAALQGADEDPAIDVIVLRGNGRAFCSGADLKMHATLQRSSAERLRYAWSGQRACLQIRQTTKPVIAAVHGYAIGAGAELALNCDLVVIAEGAEFRLPEISIGTIVTGGLTQLLPALVGRAKARELIMLSRRIPARRAYQLGLVVDVVPEPELANRCREIAGELASASETSNLRLAKELLNASESAAYSRALADEVAALAECMQTQAWRDGVARSQPVAGSGG